MRSQPNAKSLFLEAMEKAPAQRAAYLEAACGGDSALRERVEVLLQAHDTPNSLLDQPVFTPPAPAQARPDSSGTVLTGDTDASAPSAGADSRSSEQTIDQPSSGADSEEGLRRSLSGSLPVAPSRALPQVPGYHTVELLGEGGMGAVYRAVDQRLHRLVALKVLTGATVGRLERFQVEAQAAARLLHPNIVQIFAVGEQPGTAYLVLELVEGGSLAERLGGKPQPPRDAAGLLRRAALAVQHAHEHGIVHRDLKPANVLLAPGGTALRKEEGRRTKDESETRPSDSSFLPHPSSFLEWEPKIADFGLARLGEAEGGHTQEGEILGTPSYMAPEQASGHVGQIGPATDVYALGAILYEMLTGRPPFQGQTMLDTLEQVLASDPVPPRRLQPKVPRDLETICLKCLQKEPPKRYSSARELAEDLERFLGGQVIRARPVSRPERLWRWAQRHKGLAAALAAAALFLVGLSVVSGLAAEHFRWLAGANATLAGEKEKERASAVQARELAQKRGEELRSSLYQAQMILAGEAADSPSGIARVNELLAPWRGGSPDLRGWEWYYLYGLGQGALLDLPGHGEWTVAAYSTDGTRLATTGADGILRIRDGVTGREFRCLQASAGVRALAWSPDGSRLAAGGNDFLVRVWDAADGTLLAAFPGHWQYIPALAWSPDGTRLASGSDDSTIKVWQAPPSRKKGNGKSPGGLGGLLGGFGGPTLRGHKSSVYALAWSPDGSRLASDSHDGSIRVWDMMRPGESFVLNGEGAGGWGLALAWNPAGSLLASGGPEPVIRIWDMTSRKTKHELSGHVHHVLSLAWNPDGTQLASGGRDHTAKVWDPARGEATWTLRGHPGPVYSVAWSPDGTQLVSAAGAIPGTASHGGVHVWRLPPEKASRTLNGHGGAVQTVAWSPAGRLASAAHDGTVRVWDPRSGRLLRQLESEQRYQHLLCWSPDGRRLVRSDPGDSIRITDLGGGRSDLVLPAEKQALVSAWSPDGRWLAVGGWNQAIQLWDMGDSRRREKPHLLGTPLGHALGLAWSPRSGLLASAGHQRNLQIWDPVTGWERKSIKGMSLFRTVAWSPDETRLASGDEDHMVRIWDATTGKELLCLRGHTNTVESVAWSPDGTRLASASSDHTVRIWDAEGGREVLCLRGHTGPVHTVAWSPDGRQLASGDEKNTILIHDAGPGLLAERSNRLLPELTGEALSVRARQLRGEVLARKGEWERAAADFRQVPADGPNAWFSAGWWLAGPFLPGEAEPDSLADPCLPQPDGRGPAWLPIPSRTGEVELGRSLPAGKGGCAHAMQRIWSPLEQEVAARVEASGAVRLLLNGRAVHETEKGHPPGQPDEVRFVLPAGWSTLAFRVASSEKAPRLLFGLSSESERAWERVRDLIVAERWPEAAEALARSDERHPATSAWGHETAGRLAVGLVDRLRQSGKEESARGAVRTARRCFERVLAARPDKEEIAGLLAAMLADDLESRVGTVLRPKEVSSAGKVPLEIRPDHSVLASGMPVENDTYTVVVETNLTGITAVGLEALPDPSLPCGGPGRENIGNFHLRGLTVTAGPAENPEAGRLVPLVRAASTPGARNNPPGVHGAMDSTPDTYWAVWPNIGRASTAWFELAQPVGEPGRTRLTLRMTFSHALGHFRVVVRPDKSPVLCYLLGQGARRGDDGGWTSLGAARLMQGEWAAARDALLQASKDPLRTAPEVRLLLALAYLHLGQSEEARKVCDDRLPRRRDFPDTEELRELAFEVVSQQLLRAPRDPWLLVERANRHFARGLHELALADLEAARQQVHERWVEPAADQTLERYLERRGTDTALAEPAVAEVVKRRPGVWEYLAWLLLVQADLGRREAYQRSSQELFRRFGHLDDPAIQFYMATDSQLLSVPKDERQALERGRRVAKNGGRNWLPLALACYRAGRWEEGLRALDEARKGPLPDDEEVWRKQLLALIQYGMAPSAETRAALARARQLVPKPRPRHWTEVVRNRQFTRLVKEALAGKKASR